ncbi:hypothetical protein HID58_074882 [Brassica napus]|uniref:Uncharacterized protein n=1 Tax=Brassica napus TaxID=3708 RepID=A0ABQ7YI07_BRANA|nr:hypothetical protein HID58_074882 [Brassica napus]
MKCVGVSSLFPYHLPLTTLSWIHDHDDVPPGHRKHVDQKLPAKPKGPHSPLQFSAQSIPQGPTTCFINSKTIIYGVMYGKDMASSITKCNGNHWESREDGIYHQWASMYAWDAAISKASSFGASCISEIQEQSNIKIDTTLDKFDKMSKLVSKVPSASNHMNKLLHPLNLSDMKIVTVCRDVGFSKTSGLIRMSLVVYCGPKRTITQDNKQLEKRRYSFALEPIKEYFSWRGVLVEGFTPKRGKGEDGLSLSRH